MYRQMSEHRVLHFKSPDDWITYNRKFGTGDPFKSLMSHVHKMTRDIAVMQEFGPSPHMGMDYMRQYAEKRARDLGDEALGRGSGTNKKSAEVGAAAEAYEALADRPAH